MHPNGKLYFTNGSSLLRLDSPDRRARRAHQAEEPGGLAIAADGTIVMGVGNSIANGQVGDQTGPVEPDPDRPDDRRDASRTRRGCRWGTASTAARTAASTRRTTSARTSTGSANGETERGWAKVESGNGLQVDSTGKWLYVAQTFRPAAIQRVEIANPQNVTPFAVAPARRRDRRLRRHGPRRGRQPLRRGERRRLDLEGHAASAEMCVLLRGLPPFPDGPSAVTVGVHGSAFPPENLYVVAFNGDVTEIEGVVDPGRPPKLRLQIVPPATVAGERTRFRARSPRTTSRSRARSCGWRGGRR